MVVFMDPVKNVFFGILSDFNDFGPQSLSLLVPFLRVNAITVSHIKKKLYISFKVELELYLPSRSLG